MKSLLQQATLVILGLASLTFAVHAAESPAKVTADKAPPAQWPAMATAGDPLAQALLARAYLYGMDGQSRSTKDAAAWAEKSGSQNHPLGLFVQGCCLYFDWTRPTEAREIGSRPYFDKAAREGFQKRAEQEGRQWMGMLGDACFFGLGIPKNEPEAVKYLLKAAAAGSPYAMGWLGYCHENGLGVMTNEDEAANWYRKAADLGDARAKEALEKLQGVEK